MTKDQKAPDITSGVREGSVRDSSSVQQQHHHHQGPRTRNGSSGSSSTGGSSSAGQASGSRSSPTAMSSGFPAPAMVVPYVARSQSVGSGAAESDRGHGTHDEANYWPPSPPSTPSSSPQASPTLGQMRELSLLDDDVASDASHGAQSTSASGAPDSPSMAHRLLTQAATGIAMTARDVPVSQRAAKNQHGVATTPRQPPHHSSAVMPATPEQTPTTMSPADAVVRHRPFEEASQFLHSIFPAFPADPSDVSFGRAEGSGVEIACPGWKGAVLDRSLQVRSGNAGSGGGGSQPDRTLYVAMPPTLSNVKLREDVLTTLDLASEKLACGYVVIALEHERMVDFPATLHGLCYVGAQIVKGGVPPASERRGSESKELKPREGIVLAAIEM